MQLVHQGLRSRSFLLQFFAIMEEFGDEIPWLDGLRGLTWSTNATFFRDHILRRLGCEEEGIVPYQFVTPDQQREFVGGVVHFTRSPENFRDRRNIEVMERLVTEGYHYISCLQVRSPFRGVGVGDTLMRRALRSIQASHSRVWGVVSHPELIPWYVGLGATVQSPRDNRDKLWIISWVI